jgi:transposase
MANNFELVLMQDGNTKDDVDTCMKELSTKWAYTLYKDQDKVRFFKLISEKVTSVSAAVEQLGIHVRTTQRWTQMYKMDPDIIFIKHKITGCSCILHEEHKQVILEYIVENPSAALEQVMKRLLQKFQDLKVSKSTVYSFVKM